MRSLLAALLLIASVSRDVLGFPHHEDSSQGKRRKTLGFGPRHPHAVFHSSPHQISTNAFSPLGPDSDPFDVAHQFLEDILGDQLSESYSFVLRKDSYTDQNTGVTHIYVRQIVNGLEVADGDININVKDGWVLSYGNSFYNGPVPPPFLDVIQAPFSDPHCLKLSKQLDDLRKMPPPTPEFHQVTMDASPHHYITYLEQRLASECTYMNTAQDELYDQSISDPREALLHFMAVATPNQHVLDDIANRFREIVGSMSSTVETHFVGSHAVTVEMIDNVPDAVGPVKSKLAYAQVPNGESTALRLVWRFEVEMKDNWYETTVSVKRPYEIISVVDWASDSAIPHPRKPKEPAVYNVFQWGINDPAEGSRSIAKENYDILASPIGWHALPYANDPSYHGHKASAKGFYRNTTTTWGNNVFAHENWEGHNDWVDNHRPDGGDNLKFDHPYNPQKTEPIEALEEAKKYIDAAITQLFYTTNMVHDLFYRYGFDEVSGNFQQYNFGRGGEENDAVIANAQDGSGFNNANFFTPPDGQNGRCRMYIWNTATPYRDGDLEAGIVIHEMSHGMSTRMTGGPANSGCLGWGESGGMGEGWGDFLATVIRSNKSQSDYPMGAWASNRDGGIRNYPYSLDDTINPSTYKTLDNPGYWGVHAIGEVWAEILWVVNQALVAKHGFTDNLFPPPPLPDGTIPEGDFYRMAEYTASGKRKPLVPKHGNALSVQLVLNGMKLQVCRPSFFNARDAIIQADQVLTGGENFCELWRAFSSRGLGPKARVDGRTDWGGGFRTNDFGVPLACEEPTPEEPEEPEAKEDDLPWYFISFAIFRGKPPFLVERK